MKLCKFELGCRDGDKCGFSHGSAPGGTAAVMPRQQRPAASKAGSSTPCREWEAAGRCHHGDKRRFTHGSDPGGTAAVVPRQQRPAASKAGSSTPCFAHAARLATARASQGAGRQPVAHDQCHAWATTGRCHRGECRFKHGDQPATASARAPLPPRPDDPLRRFFDKLTHDGNAQLSDPRHAERYAAAAKAYADDDLIFRLTRRDEHGLQRLREVVQLGAAPTAITMIQVLMHARWSAPKYAAALKTCLRELWAVRELADRLTAAVSRGSVRKASQLKAIADFGVAVAFATPDEQHGPAGALSALAAALVERSTAEGDAATRRSTERFLLLVNSHDGASAGALGVVDDLLPGGRHSNDHVSFRQISVLPTVDEVFAATPPFLPRARADAAFLRADPEAQFLDRNFRLLREDFLSPLRESLQSQVSCASQPRRACIFGMSRLYSTCIPPVSHRIQDGIQSALRQHLVVRINGVEVHEQLHPHQP